MPSFVAQTFDLLYLNLIQLLYCRLLQTNAATHRVQTSLKIHSFKLSTRYDMSVKFPTGGGGKPILNHPSEEAEKQARIHTCMIIL